MVAPRIVTKPRPCGRAEVPRSAAITSLGRDHRSRLYVHRSRLYDGASRGVVRGRIFRDQTGDVPALEAGVDVHHGDVRGATVQHAQQGGDAAEAGPVADAGGNGDHRAGDVPAHHAGQRPLHARHHHHRVRIDQQRQVGGQPVRAGHAHVLDHRHRRAGPERRFAGLLGHRQVARARGDDRHFSLTSGVVFALFLTVPSSVGNSERAADRVVSGGRIFPQQFGGLLRRDAGGQRVGPVIDQGIENLHHRGGGLSFGEDHLGKSAAPRAVEVDLRVAQVGDSPPPGLMDELIERQLSRQQPFGKFSELHD